MATQDEADTAEILKSIPLLKGIGKRDRQALAKSSRLRRLEPYSQLVQQGDVGESCFILLEGTAEVVRNSHRVAELSPGAVFGELSLIDGGERTAGVTMLTRGEVLEVQKVGFDRMLGSSSDAGANVIAQLCSRLRDLDSTVYG